MCWCTPSIRTPNCGKTNCVPPKNFNQTPVIVGTPPSVGIDWKYRALAAEKALAEAKAELERLKKQEHVAQVTSGTGFGQGMFFNVYWHKPELMRPGVKLYAEPKLPTHPGATHCGNCGCTWLDDGMNPLGCPYCKPTTDIAPKK